MGLQPLTIPRTTLQLCQNAMPLVDLLHTGESINRLDDADAERLLAFQSTSVPTPPPRFTHLTTSG